MALGGGAALGAGLFGLKLLEGPLEEAKKFQSEVGRFAALGLGDEATKSATRFASSMNIMGQSARDNMKLLREATGIMGDLHHAQEALPLLAKMRFGLGGLMGEGKASEFEGSLMASLKVAELRGSLVNRTTGNLDLAKFASTLNLMTQAYVASGGLVKPQDYLAAIKTGGVSTKMMSDEMFFFGLGHFMQESGGSRTGTAAMSMFQNWEMGRMPQRVAERMASLGLLNQSALHYGKTGHITGVDPMGIVNARDFATNPFAWVNSQVVPALKARGFSGDDLNLQLASLLGIRTASNLADQFVREQSLADRYIKRAGGAANVDTLYNIAANTLQGKEIDLHAKWMTVLKNLGEAVLPMAIKAVEGLTVIFRRVGDFTAAYPGLTKVVVAGGLVFSTLLTLGGTLLLARAGFSAIGLALSFTGIGGIAGLGKIASGIGLIGGALRGLGLVGLAGAGGYAAGTAVYNATAGTRYGDAVGSQIAKVLAFFGNEEAQQSVAAMNRYDAKYTRGGAAPVKRDINLVVDGRVLAKVVDDQMGRTANSGASRGTTQFDVNMAMPPISLPAGAK